MKKLRNLKKNSNNKGFSFVMVIVAIGVVAILIAVVLLLAYQNYKMKVTGLRSEDNFYSAEQVLDEIKAGLQGDMSNSVSDAYSYVMEHYSETEGQDGTRNWYFQTQYVDDLYQTLLKDGTVGEYDLAYLSNYVLQGSPGEASAVASPTDDESEAPKYLVEYADGSTVELECAVANEPAVVDEEGAELLGGKPLQYNYSKGVTIKGLTVKYTNAQGYLSVVSTDLVLEIPAINFTQTATTPDLLSFALIAQEKLDVAQETAVRSTIDGNVYAGAININNAKLTIKAEDYLIAEGGIHVTGTQNDGSGDENYHFIHEGGALWTDGINLDSAKMSLDGNVYVRDDLTLNGKGSTAEIRGKYLGYSNPQPLHDVTDEAAASSAIIVNGRSAVLDFRGLSDLLLAGNGYIDIGASNGYFSDASTTSSVRMGESIAIKSNQLAYLAPADAIRVSNGRITQSGNPVGVKVNANKQLSDLNISLNTSVPLDELGGKTLGDLLIDAGDCQKYVVQQTSSDGTYTIYVYMNLDAEEASRYFAARYDSDTEKYAEVYLPAVANAEDVEDIFNTSIDDMKRFDINGNITDVANRSIEEIDDIQSEVLGYQKAFEALSKKLIISYNALSENEKLETATLFTNLINEEELVDFLGVKGGKAVFRTPETEMDAILIDGNYTVTPADANVRLIVATGNVTVEADFNGLIIAKRTVTIPSGKRPNITAVPEETAAVFQCVYDAAYAGGNAGAEDEGMMKDASENIVSPMTYFKEGEQYLLNGIASGYISGKLGEQINLTDYIRYENWQKQ